MRMQWIADYKTGIEAIDEHHESIFERINEVLDALDQGREVSTIKRLLILFESFLASHFALEEMLQERYVYPDFSSHSDEHKQLAKIFSGLILSLESGGASPYIAKDLKESIVSWWASYMAHMHSSDKQLAGFLKNL